MKTIWLAGVGISAAASGVILLLAYTGAQSETPSWAKGDPNNAVSDGRTISEIPAEVRAKLPAGTRIDPVLMQIRQVQGKWRSPVGVMAGLPDLWIELAIAGDRTWVASVRTGTLAKPSIISEAGGPLSLNPTMMTGTAKEARGSFAANIKTWEASQPKGGKIVLRGVDGRPIELIYAGL